MPIFLFCPQNFAIVVANPECSAPLAGDGGFQSAGGDLPAIRAAKAGGIRNGRFPDMEWASPTHLHSLIKAGDEIEALRILGKHEPDEPVHYDWLRGLAFHHTGNRKQAGTAFHRHFDRWP